MNNKYGSKPNYDPDQKTIGCGAIFVITAGFVIISGLFKNTDVSPKKFNESFVVIGITCVDTIKCTYTVKHTFNENISSEHIYITDRPGKFKVNDTLIFHTH